MSIHFGCLSFGIKKCFHISAFQKVCVSLYLLKDDQQSAGVAQTRFLLFSLSDSIPLPSTGRYQSLCQQFLLSNSLLAWIPFLITLSLSEFLLPSPIPSPLLTCCHVVVPARCFHPPLSQLLLPCFLHISSPIDSQSLHPQLSNSPVCSAPFFHLFSFTQFDPLLPLHSPYYPHFDADNVCFRLECTIFIF